MATPDAAPATLDEIVTALTELDQLDDIGRAAAARRLSASVSMFLSSYGDEAVYEATRAASYPTVAQRLGVSVKAVEGAVTRHRRAAGIGPAHRKVNRPA